MIARMWHGEVSNSRADAYFAYLKQTGIPDSQKIKGNKGVYVLKRVDEDRAHFLFISLWESIEAISAFAGGEIEKARYYEEDKDYLLELEPLVRHFEVLLSP